MDLLTLHLHSYKRVICITIVTKTLQEYIYIHGMVIKPHYHLTILMNMAKSIKINNNLFF